MVEAIQFLDRHARLGKLVQYIPIYGPYLQLQAVNFIFIKVSEMHSYIRPHIE